MKDVGSRGWQLRSVLVGAGVMAVAAAGLVAPPSGVAASTPRCSTANLRLDKVGEDDFTSHRSWDLALRNVGSSTCQVKGYPSVRLLDRHARPEPTTVNHHGGPPHRVVLQPWHRAFFSFTFAVNGPCPAAEYANGVRVSPPGGGRGLVFYAGRFGLCGPAPAFVYVSPLMASRPF